MKKLFVFLFIFILLVSSLGFVLAVSDNANGQGNNISTKSQIKEIIQEKNRIKFEEKTGQECPENCTCTGVAVKCALEDGSREMTVYAQSGNKIVIVKGINMTTNVTLYHHNKTVYGVFKNNETKEIILPDKVKEKIKAKIKAKLENHNITLTEDGIYIVQMNKKARLFFLFPVSEKVDADINAENGEIIRIRNPWWGFLAKDVVEEDALEE
ncbi:MAG: hypothetical protein KKA64_01695 [Nanoarchaeota archaeon]|nr:hypothetical protein [Nanoarchaeota archaeon]